MRINLVGQCIAAALQIFKTQTLYLRLLLPLPGIQHGNISDKRTEKACHEELEYQNTAQSIRMNTQRRNPVRYGGIKQVSDKRKQEVTHQPLLEQGSRHLLQIIAYQQTD